MYHTTFCIKCEDFGSLEEHSGATPFIYIISIMPMNVLFYYFARHQVRQVGPEARCLLQCVVSRSRTSSVSAPKKLLLPEAAARRATVWWTRAAKRCPHKKWLRINVHIAGPASHLFDRLPSSWPAGFCLPCQHSKRLSTCPPVNS